MDSSALLHGRYQPVTVINRGSYGEVQLVRDITSGELFACKCILGAKGRAHGCSGGRGLKDASNASGRDRSDSVCMSGDCCSAEASVPATQSRGSRTSTPASRGLHEITIHEQLGRHPHIVELVDHFEHEGKPHLILEYCASGDLYEAIKNGDITTSRVSSVIIQLIDVVEHAHALGVYHRDIKPENILLGRDGTVKLADWGLATLQQDCSDLGVGSRQYMAPECFDTKAPSYDAARADIWAVGVCLLNALFGRNPFKVANQKDRLFTDFAATRESLFDIFPSMSQDVFGALRHALAIDPENRSLSALRSALVNVRTWTTDDEYDLLDCSADRPDAGIYSDPVDGGLDRVDVSADGVTAPIAITSADRVPLRVPTAVAQSLSPLSSWDRLKQFTPPLTRRDRFAALGQLDEASETFSDSTSAEGSRTEFGGVFDMDGVGIHGSPPSPPSLPPSLCDSGHGERDSDDSKDAYDSKSLDVFFAGSAPAYPMSWADEEDCFSEALLSREPYSKSINARRHTGFAYP